jgi:UTP--glucose-1-phosphate uridylyltransferase
MLNATGVRRAVIPCGGKGTRMRGLTGGRPKELIDVAGEPLLVHVLRECAASGANEVLIVTAPGKEEIERTVGGLRGSPGMPRTIDFVMQHEARGLADAIRLGRDFAGNDPLGVALPDNLFVDGQPALGQVAETHARTGKSVVAIVEISAADAERRGATSVYQGAHLEDDEFRITRIPDKGARSSTFDTGGTARAYTGVGRYVFMTDALWAIDEVERGIAPGAELDDIPLMQRLVGEARLTGRVIRGRFLDVGLPAGYLEADSTLRALRGFGREGMPGE